MINIGSLKAETFLISKCHFNKSPDINSHSTKPIHLKPYRKTIRIIIPKRIQHQPYLPNRTGPYEKAFIRILNVNRNEFFSEMILNQKPKHPPERMEPEPKPEPKVPDQPGKPIPPELPGKPNEPKPGPPERPDKPFLPNRPDTPTPPEHPTKPDQPSQPIA